MKPGPQLEDIHERMAGVVIEDLPCEKLIARYLDPPYWGNEDDYVKAVFTREQFEEMANVLAVISGHFILS
jgi:DNA adenine methylase